MRKSDLYKAMLSLTVSKFHLMKLRQSMAASL